MICLEGVNILPGVISDNIAHKVHVCDNTDDILETHTGIFINALGDKMPECDLKKGVHTSEDIKNGDMCHIYCAQSSCSAAIQYMNDHVDDFQKCDTIHYLHQGAIKMEKNKLKDGDTCHANIEAYNNLQKQT